MGESHMLPNLRVFFRFGAVAVVADLQTGLASWISDPV
jgi:hypothetical protein